MLRVQIIEDGEVKNEADFESGLVAGLVNEEQAGLALYELSPETYVGLYALVRNDLISNLQRIEVPDEVIDMMLQDAEEDVGGMIEDEDLLGL